MGWPNHWDNGQIPETLVITGYITWRNEGGEGQIPSVPGFIDAFWG